MLLSHVTYKFQSEFTLYSLPECQGTPCSKHVPCQKFKWQQQDWNPQSFSLKTSTQPFSWTGQMIEQCCENLSVWCIWLYVIIMLHTSFRVNPHSIVCLNVKKLLAPSMCHVRILSDSNRIWTVQISTHNQTDKHSQHSSIILPVWLNGWVLVYELSRCGFEFRCCHIQIYFLHICIYISMK